MYRQIVLDCQTKKDIIHCEDCIAYSTCKIRAQSGTDEKASDISVVNSEIVGVWEKWKKRKSLPT